ncbi:ABC transporter permease [Tepidiforma sp.]|uniref:ABC transporter permease n=1 Tax=Tepidiforma sp. TaxID=2682230 RepID=UPI002ADDBECC|nr:ABC transporter permease [Tepidiforma sp.]
MAATEQPIAQPFDFMEEHLHARQRGLWAQAWQRLLRNRLAVIAGVILLVISALSLAADFSSTVQRYDPAVPDFQATEQNPSRDHWLGTDTLGRDLWARLLQGTLFSLKIGLGTQVIVLLIGITIGMAAALAGRTSDTALMWLTDLAYAFPDLLAIILLRQVLLGRDWPIIGEGDPQIPGFGGVLLVTVIAISFVSWTTVARLVRGQMLSIKEQDYVTAARAMGASPWRIVRVHMLPNTLSAVIVSATFGIPLAIFAEATLGFIGLGVPPPNASLGSLIGSGLDAIQVHPAQLVWPTSMVAVLMLCFTFLGDGLRDALDPRTRH